jgi:hypothetical protein
MGKNSNGTDSAPVCRPDCVGESDSRALSVFRWQSDTGGALSHRAIVNLDVLDNFEPGPALSAIDTDKGGKRQTEQEDVGGRRPFSPRGYWADGVTSTSGQTGSGGTAIRSGTAAWAVTATTITPSAASIAAIRFIAGLLGLGVLAT